ncbi:Glyoxylate/hydroxypyruvate reductase B [Moorella humiferrea]|uniref:D-2-hydroxyacid dehydrogenase n=1 Tax=Neomoorella humiferrea TaxID=676965 RepID=UPI0030CAAE11
MQIKKIAIFDYEASPFFNENHIKSIQEALPGVEIIYAIKEKELRAKTTDADVLITWPFITEEMVEFCKGAPSLKWIHSIISGVEGLMNSEIRNLDIRITSTKGIHGFPMAEHVLAYIFSFLRALPVFFRSQLKKEWNDEAHVLCDETINKTVGIIGLGNIGMHIAKKCKLLGFRVVALKRTPIQSEWVDKCYSAVEIDQLLKESDFVIVTVPYTPQTHHLIGEKELRMMKKTAYFINVARGGVVDQEALIKVLQENTIAGAGLDVFAEEPLPSDNPLWDLPNVILTPHIAARSPYYMDRAIKVVIENLLRFSRDEELLFEVDKVRGY